MSAFGSPARERCRISRTALEEWTYLNLCLKFATLTA
jgi:hypothetical protein